jgi:chorismate dehydratase
MASSPGKLQRTYRIGVVPFLNAKPLIYGLEERRDLTIRFEVPSRLPSWLDEARVDAALVPVVDMLQSGRAWKIVSDAIIGCDGETLTVRVFSRTPPDRVRHLWADPASHTSVALARLIWQETYECELEVQALDGPPRVEQHEAVLLIGDRVVAEAPFGFTYQTDLGGAWKTLTGLPFVFAVWAARAETDVGELPDLLSRARDRGVERSEAIAAEQGPRLGWPPAVARTYLTRNLSFTLGPRHREGMRTFLTLAGQRHIAPGYRELLQV